MNSVDMHTAYQKFEDSKKAKFKMNIMQLCGHILLFLLSIVAAIVSPKFHNAYIVWTLGCSSGILLSLILLNIDALKKRKKEIESSRKVFKKHFG